MGYLKVPKIKVDLPIYHGTSEEVFGKRRGTCRRDRSSDRRSEPASGHQRAQRSSKRGIIYKVR